MPILLLFLIIGVLIYTAITVFKTTSEMKEIARAELELRKEAPWLFPGGAVLDSLDYVFHKGDYENVSEEVRRDLFKTRHPKQFKNKL